MSETPNRRASLEVLRAEAADELAVLVHERLRHGEDPWDFMQELPGVDQLVVLLLRAEEIEYSDDDRLDETENFRVLRRIALDYPELTTVVWALLDNAAGYRRWDQLAEDPRI